MDYTKSTKSIKRNVMSDIKKPMLERLISQSTKQPITIKIVNGEEKEEPYVKKISNLVYEELRYKLVYFIDNLCLQLAMIAEFQNTKMITRDMVYMVLTELPLVYGDLPMCNPKDHTEYKKKETDCLYIDKKIMKNLFIEKGYDFLIGIDFDQDAMQLLHVSSERYLRTICMHASYVSAGRKKRTLFPSDLQFAVRYMYPQTNHNVRNPLAQIKKIVRFDSSIDGVSQKISGSSLPKKFVDQLNVFLNVLSKTVITVAYRLKNPKSRTIIRGKDLLNAVKYFMPGELRKHAYSNMKSIPSEFNKKTVRKLDHALNLDDETIEYLSRLLEYFTAEVIQLKDENKNNTFKTFKMIFENDEELNHLLRRMEVYSVNL